MRALVENTGEVACCLHGKIEVLTVSHRKLRERAFPPRAFGALCQQFEADCESAMWEWLPLSAKLVAGLSDRIRHLPATIFIRAPTPFIWRAQRNKASKKFTPTTVICWQLRHTSGCEG